MTFLPVPCFSRISPRATLFCVFFSLALAVVLKYSAPPPGEKIVQDCKSTLNQQWDGTESYLSAAECAYCFIKKKKKEEMLFYCRCRTSAAQNRADPLMSPVVLFFFPLSLSRTLWPGRRRASAPFGLSFTVEQPSMWSKWEKMFRQNGRELMKWCLGNWKTDSAHGCFWCFCGL